MSGLSSGLLGGAPDDLVFVAPGGRAPGFRRFHLGASEAAAAARAAVIPVGLRETSSLPEPRWRLPRRAAIRISYRQPRHLVGHGWAALSEQARAAVRGLCGEPTRLAVRPAGTSARRAARSGSRQLAGGHSPEESCTAGHLRPAQTALASLEHPPPRSRSVQWAG